MESEEWRVKSEEWRVKSGEGRVESEEWKVKSDTALAPLQGLPARHSVRVIH